MLQLRRPIHGAPSVAPGHLTTALSWPSMPSRSALSTGMLVPGNGLLCRNRQVVTWEGATVLAVCLLCWWRPGHTYQQCPLHGCSRVHAFS